MKGEPLSLSLTKLIIVVSIIVSLGAIAGVVGYLDKNKPAITPQSQVSSVQPIIDELILAELKKLQEGGVKGESYKIKSKTNFYTINENFYYLAVIFEGKFGETKSNDVLKIYRVKEGNIEEMFRESEYSMEADFQDINKDNIPEIILGLSTGGNCAGCYRKAILQIKSEKIEPIIIHFPAQIAVIAIDDLDKNGYSEIIGFDARWQYYKDVCHACSPAVEIIGRWEDGVYRIASDEFPEFYDNEISEIESELKDPFDEEYYFGDLISLLLNYLVRGEKERGFLEFKKYANAYDFKSPDLKAEILRIKSNLNKWIKEEGVDKLFPWNETSKLILQAYRISVGTDYDLSGIIKSINEGELFASKIIENPYDKTRKAIVIKFKDSNPHGILIVDNKNILNNQYLVFGALEHFGGLTNIRWTDKKTLAFILVGIDEGGISEIPKTLKVLDVSADWKTYRNEEYGFEIKYPNEAGKSSKEMGSILKPYIEKTEIPIGNYFLNIGVAENSSRLPIKRWLEEEIIKPYTAKEFYLDPLEIKQMQPEDFILHELKGAKIGYLLPYPPMRAGSCSMYYFPKNSKVYSIGFCQYEAFTDSNGDPELYERVGKQKETILSTFKFIELNPLAKEEISADDNKWENAPPAEIKNLSTKNNATYLSIDILSRNPNFAPGMTSFFINKSEELREVKIDNNTKFYECGAGPDNNSTTADVSSSIDDLLNHIQQGMLIYYFDITDSIVKNVYEQCLP